MLVPSRVDCYIVRHAHRDTTDRALDNGLSRQGRDQAARLAARFASLGARYPSVIRSSPMRRCLETAAPLAGLFGLAVRVDEDLGERRAGESRVAFRIRIGRVLRRVRVEGRGGRPVILVTHGDVVALAPAVALRARPGAHEPFPCAKGAFHHLRLERAGWTIVAANDRAHLAGGSGLLRLSD